MVEAIVFKFNFEISLSGYISSVWFALEYPAWLASPSSSLESCGSSESASSSRANEVSTVGNTFPVAIASDEILELSMEMARVEGMKTAAGFN